MADELMAFDTLTDRQRQVLRIVVQEYVEQHSRLAAQAS